MNAAIMPIVGQDGVHYSVNKGYVSAEFDPDVYVRLKGQLNPAGIHHDQLGTSELCTKHPVRYQRMSFGSIGAHHQETVRVLDFRDRVCHSATSECSGKTCHCRSVSETSAMIDIVGSETCPAQFLQQVVVFIGAAGRGEETDAVPAVLRCDLLETRGGEVKRLFPGRFRQLSILTDKRSGQPFRTVDEFVSVPSLDAELALIHRGRFKRNSSNQAAVHNLEKHLAAAPAKRAGCCDKAIIHSRFNAP